MSIASNRERSTDNKNKAKSRPRGRRELLSRQNSSNFTMRNLVCGAQRILLILVILASPSHGVSVCPRNGRTFGLEVSPGDELRPFRDDGATGETYVMYEKGRFNCLGSVKMWTFSRPAGRCDRLDLMVWREEAPNRFRLIGSNLYTCSPLSTATTVEVLKVPESEQILVKPGDMIGWKRVNGTGGSLYFSSGVQCPECGQVVRLDCSDPPEDAVCATGSVTRRDFSIQARVHSVRPPFLSNLPAAAVVPEDLPVGASVFRVLAFHRNQAHFRPSLDIHFSANQRRFPIDSQSGHVTLQSALNASERSRYVLSVTASCYGVRSTESLDLHVRPVNRAHRLERLSAAVNVDVRLTEPGYKVFRVVVIEPDQAVTQPDKIFAVTSSVPASRFAINQQGEVYCVSSMQNWTASESVELEIVVRDDVHVAAPLVLTVNMANRKEAPRFANLPQSVALSESTASGSVVFQVVARSPHGGVVGYVLARVDPVTAAEHFRLDSRTGEIFTATSYDAALVSRYKLTLTSVDELGLESTEGTLVIDVTRAYSGNVASVTVTCRTNVPEKRIDPPTGFVAMRLNECYTFPSNSKCDIISGDNFFFRLQDCDLLLVVRMIDLDTYPSYEEISVSVQFSQGGTSLGIVEVLVTMYDVNDNWPTFMPNKYSGVVFENTRGGNDIEARVAVSATDRDFSKQALTYSLRDDATDAEMLGTTYFQINETDGVITTRQPIDFERYTSASFHVIATDSGGLATQADVIINIINVNDVAPEVACPDSEEIYSPIDPMGFACFRNIELRNDVLLGYHVITFIVTDDDGPEELAYMLPVIPHFRLNETSGSLTVIEHLYEYHSYVMYVYGQDNGDPNLQSEKPAVLRVDSFLWWRHLVDVTLGVTVNATDVGCATCRQFVLQLRELLDPWHVQMDGFTRAKDRTVVTIYALENNSTFSLSNLCAEKTFVGRYEVLKKLRKDITGSPRREVTSGSFEKFKVRSVDPHYVYWWVDTVAGIVTIAVLSLLLLVLLLVVSVCLCRHFHVCCFKTREESLVADRRQSSISSLASHLTSSDLRRRRVSPQQHQHQQQQQQQQQQPGDPNLPLNYQNVQLDN